MSAIGEDARNEAYDSHDVYSFFEEITLIEHLARAVSSIQGMHPDYAFLASELAHALPFNVLGIVLLRHDGRAVRVTICSHNESTSNESTSNESTPDAKVPALPVSWQVQYHQHPLGGSMFERMAQTPTLLVNEYPHGLDGLPSSSGDALSSFHQLHSTCIVPLRTHTRIFGTLELGSNRAGTYRSAGIQRLANAIAQMLATAIERAQLGGNTQIQDRQRQALQNVSTALASKADVAVVLDHITSGISNALNVSSLLVTYDASEQSFQLVANAGFDATQLTSLVYEKEALQDTITGCTIIQRQPFLSDDIELDSRFPASQHLYTQLQMRSILCYPLIADNIAYGALLLCSPDSGGFTPLKVDIVALFANQAAIAIREGIFTEAASQRQNFQRVMEQLEREIHEPLSDEEELRIFTQIRAEVRRTFDVSLSSLLTLLSNSLLTKEERSGHIVAESRLQETSEQVSTVLMRADILGELSRLLVQQEQATHGVRDVWLVCDPTGRCIYINPLAETFFNVRLPDIEQHAITLETIFTSFFSRIRNLEEVKRYLRGFIEDEMLERTICCVLAQQALSLRAALEGEAKETMGILAIQGIEDSTDSYYQFLRHSLHNQQGQLIAYALQIHDVTTRTMEEANKSALLSSVSHHLRTPLTTIKASVTGLLQDDIPWSESLRREMLEDIDQETDHLTVLINGLVELSRIEMGALVLEKAWCSIEEIVYSALTKWKHAFHVIDEHTARVQIANASPLVYVDYLQIERVIYNLLENAVRHQSGQNAFTITVDVVEEGTPFAQLRVRLAYRGEHIPVQERKQLFRSFDRLHTTGNGLGLAICQGIIEAHEGKIWIESDVNGETCFICMLPIYISHPVQQR